MIDDKIRIEALHKDIESFMEDIKRLQIKNAKLYEKIINAIEYIKNNELCEVVYDYDEEEYNYVGIKKLLEILGDDKNV